MWRCAIRLGPPRFAQPAVWARMSAKLGIVPAVSGQQGTSCFGQAAYMQERCLCPLASPYALPAFGLGCPQASPPARARNAKGCPSVTLTPANIIGLVAKTYAGAGAVSVPIELREAKRMRASPMGRTTVAMAAPNDNSLLGVPVCTHQRPGKSGNHPSPPCAKLPALKTPPPSLQQRARWCLASIMQRKRCSAQLYYAASGQ